MFLWGKQHLLVICFFSNCFHFHSPIILSRVVTPSLPRGLLVRSESLREEPLLFKERLLPTTLPLISVTPNPRSVGRVSPFHSCPRARPSSPLLRAGNPL